MGKASTARLYTTGEAVGLVVERHWFARLLE